MATKAEAYEGIAKSYAAKGDTAMARYFQNLANAERANSGGSISPTKTTNSTGYRPEFDDNRQAPGYPSGVTIGMVEKAKGPSMSVPNGKGGWTNYYGEEAVNNYKQSEANRRADMGDDAYYAEAWAKSPGGQSYFKGVSIGPDTVTFTRSDGSKYMMDRATWDQLRGTSGSGGYSTSSVSPSIGQPDQQMAMYQQLYQQIQDMMNSQSQIQREMMRQLEEQARRQAEAIAQQRQASLEQLIEQLKDSQKSGLMGIANSVEDAKMALEDQTFQQWLAARQAMANRGLAGSGLASDQDTRLLLQKQRDLSGIFRDAERNRFDLTSRIGNQLEQAYQSLADINVDDIYADQFAQLYNVGRSQLMDQAKLYADLFKTILPYEQMTSADRARNEVDWARLAVENNYNIGRLTNEQQRLALDNAKYLLDERRVDLDYWEALGYMPDPSGSGKLVPTAATTQAERRMALDEAKARGYFVGPNGEIIPTEERRSNEANEALRGQELVAQMAQWTEQNKLAAQRIELDKETFRQKAAYDQKVLDRAGAELQLSADRNQLSGYQDQLSSVDRQISNLLSADPTASTPGSAGYNTYYQLMSQRDRIMDGINSIFRRNPATHTDSNNSMGFRYADLGADPILSQLPSGVSPIPSGGNQHNPIPGSGRMYPFWSGTSIGPVR